MEDAQQSQVYALWIDWKNRVISFREVEGYQKKGFPSYEQMLAYAVEKGFEGFGIS